MYKETFLKATPFNLANVDYTNYEVIPMGEPSLPSFDGNGRSIRQSQTCADLQLYSPEGESQYIETHDVTRSSQKAGLWLSKVRIPLPHSR